MIKEKRHQYILKKVRSEKMVSCSELSEQLRVSEDTIRRDLHELAEEHLLKKVHGGAISRSPIPYRYKDREEYGQKEKEIIAQKAAPLVRDGQVLFMTGGTTLVQVAMHFPEELHATVVTNNIPAISYLTRFPNIEIVAAGGNVLKETQVMVGTETISTISQIHADLCLASLCSIHPETGLTLMNREEADVERAMFSASRQVIGLAATEKLDTTEPYVVGKTDILDVLITEADPGHELLSPYKEMGIRVL